MEELPAGALVADLGCGNGTLLSRLRGRGCPLAGVDLSTSGIAVARRQWLDMCVSSRPIAFAAKNPGIALTNEWTFITTHFGITITSSSGPFLHFRSCGLKA